MVAMSDFNGTELKQHGIPTLPRMFSQAGIGFPGLLQNSWSVTVVKCLEGRIFFELDP
jgi:hypothetical protein